MEKFLKPYDKEFMRMAMLKHEETFKEQVNELHRLYRIQKILMRNIGSKRPNTQGSQELWNSKNSISFAQKSIMKLDLERPADQDYAVESSGDHRAALEIIDESEIELTLGPSSYNRGNRKKRETPLTSDSGPSSFSSSSTGSSHINKTASSLGHHKKMNTKKSEEASGGRELGIVQVPDMTLGNYQSENRTSSNIDVDEQLRQERLKQPPWLFQVLSLNMT
ncbi:uncharacterized protein LOC8261659 [Ricinus communis]|uniref:Uncharacterized protein n=1 Tax=Ricinus communis TaxID=3988 RepID=B9T4I8_RICCO|nr:uncharacterized protein LOC8261659 [Ricinus communis]EEF29216.1 conserved hypothetical protein [Ricinus communis]|eukprot:XP_002533157.1 uncharacterized protein LOC8261659 [Ricinus communis]